MKYHTQRFSSHKLVIKVYPLSRIYTHWFCQPTQNLQNFKQNSSQNRAKICKQFTDFSKLEKSLYWGDLLLGFAWESFRNRPTKLACVNPALKILYIHALYLWRRALTQKDFLKVGWISVVFLACLKILAVKGRNASPPDTPLSLAKSQSSEWNDDNRISVTLTELIFAGTNFRGRKKNIEKIAFRGN